MKFTIFITIYFGISLNKFDKFNKTKQNNNFQKTKTNMKHQRDDYIPSTPIGNRIEYNNVDNDDDDDINKNLILKIQELRERWIVDKTRASVYEKDKNRYEKMNQELNKENAKLRQELKGRYYKRKRRHHHRSNRRKNTLSQEKIDGAEILLRIKNKDKFKKLLCGGKKGVKINGVNSRRLMQNLLKEYKSDFKEDYKEKDIKANRNNESLFSECCKIYDIYKKINKENEDQQKSDIIEKMKSDDESSSSLLSSDSDTSSERIKETTEKMGNNDESSSSLSSSSELYSETSSSESINNQQLEIEFLNQEQLIEKDVGVDINDESDDDIND